MYSMTNINVNDKWKLFSIDYNGIGTEPYLVYRTNSGTIQMIPVKKGSTNIRYLLNLEEEE